MKIVQVANPVDVMADPKWAVACEKHKKWIYFEIDGSSLMEASDPRLLVQKMAAEKLKECPDCIIERPLPPSIWPEGAEF